MVQVNSVTVVRPAKDARPMVLHLWTLSNAEDHTCGSFDPNEPH